MNEALKIVLSLSLSGTLLILILLLLRPLFKERLSKRWQYYIWLVVVARLLLPFAPEINLMGRFFQAADRGIEQTFLMSLSTQQGDTSTSEVNMSQNGDAIDGQDSLKSEPQVPTDPAIPILMILWKNLWIGFLVVSLILFIRKITIYQSFVKYIRAGCVEVTDIDLLERFGMLVERCRIKTTVEMHTNSLISSPLLIGFFRPCIVLPTIDLSASDFEYTILHELTHYKRRDMFYKWLVQITICVHWFNPLVHLMGQEVGRSCELSCDEAIIKSLGLQERRAYGNTLLNAMGGGGNYKDTLASVPLNESKERLKERLDAIMKFKKNSKMVVIFTLMLTVFLITGATTIGAYAAPRSIRKNAETSIGSGKKKEPIDQKTEKSYDNEYVQWGIEKKNGAYYYKNKRLRIFMDLRVDHSFVYSGYDKLGTVDIQVMRNKKGNIYKLERLTKAKADEILSDLDLALSAGTPSAEAKAISRASKKKASAGEDISRLSKEEVPAGILKTINSCNTKKWYVISGNKYQYIFYNRLPHNYAYQIDTTKDRATIQIFDMGKSVGNYVLLAVPQNLKLTVKYNSKEVSYQKV